MIPLLQNDYYKYVQMFRGNYLKGATLFRSLLNDSTTREQLLESLPALSAIFTDFSKTEANRLCYDILIEKDYFEAALMSYLRGIEVTKHQTVEELLNDEENVIALLDTKELEPLFQENVELYRRALQKQATLDELKKCENSDILIDNQVLGLLSDISQRTATNIYTSYNTYYSSISGDTCEFDANETYYASYPTYEWLIVDDETEQAFLPAYIRTRVGTTSTYYYYPAVYKYDIPTETWSLLHVAETATKINDSTKQTKAVAYDPKEDLLYMFYRPNTTVQMYCDIIRASTGVAIMTAVDVGSVGSTSYMTPFYCSFDKENGVAKYVWAAGAVNSTNSTYGWLYGCSVGKNGLVWKGIVATPRSECTSYSSEMQAVNYPYKYSCSKGAYVCAFSNSSATNTACTLGFIVHSGLKMVAKYLVISSNTDYANIYNPSSVMVTEDGLMAMYYNNITYKSESKTLVLLIDIEKAKIVGEFFAPSTSNGFTLYLSSLLKKIAFYNAKDATTFYIVGMDENSNLVSLTTDTLPSLFKTEVHRPMGTERYKFYPQNSSYWYLYDYKGGFVE